MLTDISVLFEVFLEVYCIIIFNLFMWNDRNIHLFMHISA